MLCLLVLLTFAQGAWSHTISVTINGETTTKEISEGGNCEIDLAANTTYDFQFIFYSSEYYSSKYYNEYEIKNTLSECTQLQPAFDDSKGKLTTDLAGTYIFTHCNSQSIKVKYPASCTAPSITSHPSTEDKTYTQGDAAEALSVTADGTSLSYQWKQSASADGSYENVTGGTGANTATYTPSTDNIGTTYYKCYVSNSCGNVTSNASGAITVNAGSGIIITPASPKAYEVITLSTQSGGNMTWAKTDGSNYAYFVNADGTTTSGPTTPTNSIKFKAPAGSYTITATPAAGESNEITFTVGGDSDDCN